MKTSIRRRTSIDIETHEVTIIRAKRFDEKQFCERCAAELGEIPLTRRAVTVRQIEIEPDAPVS